MSTITIGFAPSELSGAVSSRTSVPADPEAFAAQLQSATETGTSAAAADPSAVADPAEAATSPASAALPGLVAPSAGFAQPDVPPSTPVVAAAPLPAPVPVVRPDADTPQSATPGTLEPTAPLGSSDASQPAATNEARPADPAASLAQPPATVRRGPRHATAGDALPLPISAVPAAGPPPAAPVPAEAVIASPVAQTPEEESLALQAVGGSRSTALSAGADPTPAARVDDPRNRGNETAATAAMPAVPVPVLPLLENAPPVAATTAVGNLARPAVRVISSTATDPGAFASALGGASASPTSTVTAAPALPPPVQPQPLNTQLAVPILALRTAGTGNHVLTVTVSPESVGPVTVRAHVSHGVMRVELSAPTGQGTEALKSMLPDLKRDLSQGGLDSALTIASPGSDGASAGNQNTFGAGGSFAHDDRPNQFRAAPTTSVNAAAGSPRPISVIATTGLDVLA